MGRALNGIKKMAHTVDDKTNLLAQTKQLRQKVEKLESLLTKEVSCEDVMEVRCGSAGGGAIVGR